MDRQEGTERGDPVLPPSGEDAVAEPPGSPPWPDPADAVGGPALDAIAGVPGERAGAPHGPVPRAERTASLFDQERAERQPSVTAPLALAMGGVLAVDRAFVAGADGLLDVRGLDAPEDASPPGCTPADVRRSLAERDRVPDEAPEPPADEAPEPPADEAPRGSATPGSEAAPGEDASVGGGAGGPGAGRGVATGDRGAPHREDHRGASSMMARAVAVDEPRRGSVGEDDVAPGDEGSAPPGAAAPPPRRRGPGGRVRHALLRGGTGERPAPEPGGEGGVGQDVAPAEPAPAEPAPEEPALAGAPPGNLAPVGVRPGGPATAEPPGAGPAARPAPARDAEGSPAGELGRRVATGVAFGVVAVAAFLGGPVTSLALVTVVIVLALAEAYAVLRRSGYRPATFVGLAVTLVTIPAVFHFGTAALPVAWVVALVASFTWFLSGGRRQRATPNLAVTILAFGWVGVFGAYAAALLDPTTFPHRHGVADFAGVVLLTIGYDVGAYLVGRQVGRHALLRSVSPNKTVEGLVGGVLGAIVAAVVLAHAHPWTLLHAVVVAVVVMVVAPLGDLAESLLKRDLRVKDMGTILPGHGGLLDRIDALLFVLPVAYYVLEILHVH